MPNLSVVAAQAPSMTLKGGTVDVLAKCAVAEKVTDIDAIDQFSALWLIFYNTDSLDECGFEDHNINAKNFQSTDRSQRPYDRVMKKGAVEHWRVVSGFDGHPFHIHINPFVACPLPPSGSSSPNAKGRLFEPPFAHWRDTYLVNLDRMADFVTEYRAFTGTYVNHCHKLTHEDHGMMELVHVCDPEVEDCDTLCDGGPCNWNACAADDDDCRRRLVATKCLLKPEYCAEAQLRCQPCDESRSCPAGASCADASSDGVARCVPGAEAEGSSRTDEPARPAVAHAKTCPHPSGQREASARRVAHEGDAGLVRKIEADSLTPAGDYCDLPAS